MLFDDYNSERHAGAVFGVDQFVAEHASEIAEHRNLGVMDAEGNLEGRGYMVYKL